MDNLDPNTEFAFEDVSDDGANSDRRSQQRHKTIMRVAKLTAGSVESLGIVRNVSEQGMMLEIHPDFALGDVVTITLDEDEVLQGYVRWQREGSAGVWFDNAIDLARALSKRPKLEDNRVTRLPRIRVHQPIDLVVNSEIFDAEICDISLGGVRVKTKHRLERGASLMLRIPDFSNIPAVVRWQSGDYAGLAFYRPVSIQGLMSWLATHVTDAMPDRVGPPVEASQLLAGPHTDADGEATDYEVVAFDEAGAVIPIALVQSASAALTHLNASRPFFYRVVVKCGDNDDLFPSELLRRAEREAQ